MEPIDSLVQLIERKLKNYSNYSGYPKAAFIMASEYSFY